LESKEEKQPDKIQVGKFVFVLGDDPQADKELR
jgi:hypothetical protein